MKSQLSTALAVCIAVQILGVFLFCVGFFPQRVPLKGYNTHESLPPDFGTGQKDAPDAKFGKVVIMLVDAFRADFLYSNDSSMDYVRHLIQSNQTFSYIATAQAPTVTLPRIKALTSGGIPSFMDFLFNFKSQALTEDNLITQMHLSNKKIVFYGDDTWEKLFPGHFMRHEGTVSFFVADTVEVDNNVTRHLEPELNLFDWDVMILHYLGLDHVGHGPGPYSPLMKPKQQEMDKIIEKIHKKLIENDKNQEKPTLFMFCSDHGMNEVGNHGGSSEGETSAVMVFMSSLFTGNGAHRPDMVGDRVAQVDLVPTLSVLLGLPIPKNSLGSLITEFVSAVDGDAEYLRALQINANQQFDILQAYPMFWDGHPVTEEIDVLVQKYYKARDMHKNWLKYHQEPYKGIEELYIQFLKGLQREFAKVLSSYDMYFLYTGILLLGVSSIALLVTLLHTLHPKPSSTETSLNRLMLLATSVTIAVVFYFSHLSVCDSIFKDSGLCNPTFFPVVLVALVLIAVTFYLVATRINNIQLWHPEIFLEKIWIVVGSFIHLVSLSGSSNVEEEHQTWYFLTTTLHLLLLLRLKEKKSLFVMFAILMSGRLLRAWNQTGNKWAGYPDYAKWLLTQPNAVMALGAISIAFCAIYGVFYSQRKKSIIGTTLTRIYQLSILLSGIFVGLYHFQYHLDVVIARLAFLFIIISFSIPVIFPFHNGKQATQIAPTLCYFSFTMLALIVAKSVNLFLFFLIGIQIRGVTYLVSKKLRDVPLWVLLFMLMWMGQASFFAFGNSNSLATIDIRGGYTGLDDYNEIAVPILIACTGLAGPISFFIASMIIIGKMSKSAEWTRNAFALSFLVSMFRSWVLFLFSIFIMNLRHHLFIWSVFSPKYIYELFFLGFEIVKCLILICGTFYYPFVMKTKTE